MSGKWLLVAFITLIHLQLTSAPSPKTPNLKITEELKEPLIFVHVPKTGGQSVAALLDPHFARKQILPGYSYSALDKNPIKDPTPYQLVRGHFFYAQLRHLHGKKITFLREPVKRTFSEHRFWCQFKNSPSPNWLSVFHFLPPGDPLYVMSNHQCLFLSSYDPRDPAVTIQQHLDSAMENLANDFWFVGITEDLDNGIRTLFSMLGWAEPLTIPRKNSTKPSSETFPDNIVEQIRQRNWADIQLYEFAKQLYTSRCVSDQKAAGDMPSQGFSGRAQHQRARQSRTTATTRSQTQ